MQNQMYAKQKVLRYTWLCIALLLLSSWTLFAQNLKVGGTVTDSKGEPLPGVTVVQKGSTGGTITDINGNYTLGSVSSKGVLVFSFIGMKNQEIMVNGRTVIDLTMLEDAIAIEEVVAVGYGTVKKRDMIGSVSSVSGEDLKQVSSTSFTNALQGRATGVNIRETSGTPGSPISVQVRGVNSINTGTDPLWIIDGMPVYAGGGLGRTSGTVAQNPMSTINPNDIQSVEVLKDAAATAIYGSRGSSGVIIVTTKSGKKEKGKGSVTVDYSTGVSDLTTSPESIGFANTKDWFQIMDIAKTNGGRGVFEPGDILNANFPTSISRADALNVDINWFDYVLRKGSYKDANFSYTQGLEKGAIFASFGYRSDKAVNVGNDFDRLTGRINIDLEPIKNFKTGAKLNLMYTNNYRNKTENSNPGISTGNVGGFGSAIMGELPWYPVYDTNNPSGYWNPGAGNLAVISRRDLMLDNKKTYRALGNIYGEFNITQVKGLSVRAEASTDIIQDNSTNWISGTVINSGKTYVYEGAITRTSYNYNAYLKYNNTFNEKHSINAVAGTESQLTSQYTREMDGRDPVGYNQELGSTSPGIKDNMQGYMGSERFIKSFFGRANYKFLDKYMLGMSMRRDGSSAFSEDLRWGNFAALSAGWVISEENFFKPLSSTFNQFKLRGSFGQTGNESIPGNRNINTLNNSATNRYGTTEIMSAGTSMSIGNGSITWETTDSYDVGVDFAMFKNRISGSVAYYMQNVSDMLLQISTPPSAAIGSVYGNVGDMRNWGWEFSVNSINMDRDGFKWNTSLNFSTNRNKILSLTPEMERQKGSVLYKGGRLGLFKMSEYAGIDPERGVHMIWEIDRAKYNETGAFVRTGRKIPFTDTNSTLHEVVLTDKSSIPTYYGGFDNTFTYKGFELGVFFTFSGGNYIYNSREKEWTAPSNGYWMKKTDLLTESWTTPGQTDAKYPLLFMEGFAPATTAWDLNAIDPATGLTGWWKNPDIKNLVNPTAKETYDKNGARSLTKYLEKGDYLRLKTLSLGYNIPKKLASKMYMENLKVYGSATNLLTFTGYTGFDPETGANPSILPSVKTFSAGVTITF
jgi:TonB-linked SusC/RagA family outer membrane protein